MNYAKSPLNYTGGKFKLLSQILPLLPKDIDTFVDLFCGGLDVSINIMANRIVSNDIIKPLTDMYNKIKDMSYDELDNEIRKNVDKYDLSKTNNEGYLELRKDYNESRDEIKLLTLVFYCYNNQIRFNSKWGFNRAFGEREYNGKNAENLKDFTINLRKRNIVFTNFSFESLKIDKLKNNDFVYIDPPYLITKADYSIQASWDDDKEILLLKMIDKMNEKGIRFALSNVIEHNDKSNEILKEWMKNYNVYYLNMDYSNCNAVKSKRGRSVEVLITNY